MKIIHIIQHKPLQIGVNGCDTPWLIKNEYARYILWAIHKVKAYKDYPIIYGRYHTYDENTYDIESLFVKKDFPNGLPSCTDPLTTEQCFSLYTNGVIETALMLGELNDCHEYSPSGLNNKRNKLILTNEALKLIYFIKRIASIKYSKRCDGILILYYKEIFSLQEQCINNHIDYETVALGAPPGFISRMLKECGYD